MGNYKETSITGDVQDYQRSNKVIIINELDHMPEITFMEQKITFLPDGRKLVTGNDKVVSPMGSGSDVFPLLYPDTDVVIGEASFIEVYILLYSLYRHLADKRDLEREALLAPPPEE